MWIIVVDGQVLEPLRVEDRALPARAYFSLGYRKKQLLFGFLNIVQKLINVIFL